MTDYQTRARRIGAVGGSEISELNADFCRALGYELGKEPGLVIVTGGRPQTSAKPAADECVVAGVRRRLAKANIDEHARLVTMIPEGDSEPYFEAGTVHTIRNVTRESRRFALVRYVDALITVEGKHGTPQMVDLALAFEKLVLPLPFTEGKSRTRWQAHKSVIVEQWGISKPDCAALESRLDKGSVRSRAKLVKRLVTRALKRRCFVAMPFELKQIDRTILRSFRELSVVPVRTDKIPKVGDVIETIRNSIATCECAIAVITGLNPNVMYELGLLHALGKPTILLCEFGKNGKLATLPFDLTTQYVVGYSNSELISLKTEIRTKLGALLPTI